MSDADKMKPIIILPPETLTKEDIQALRDNGLCIVEATDPSAIKFLDPIPATQGRTKIEEAAVAFTRRALSSGFWGQWSGGSAWHSEMTKAYVDVLVKGTSLDPEAPDYRIIFDREKAEEVRRIAREEAREERKAAKEAKVKEKQTKEAIAAKK